MAGTHTLHRRGVGGTCVTAARPTPRAAGLCVPSFHVQEVSLRVCEECGDIILGVLGVRNAAPSRAATLQRW